MVKPEKVDGVGSTVVVLGDMNEKADLVGTSSVLVYSCAGRSLGIDTCSKLSSFTVAGSSFF
jgi:hypothetical protein